MTRHLALLLLIGWFASVAPGFAQEPGREALAISLDSLLNTEVSTAAKYAQLPREAAASVTVVPHEEIRMYGYRTVADVLAATPGFYMTDDRTFVTAGVRGFGRPFDFSNRILLLVNGNTVNDNVVGAASVGPELSLNLDAVERVEIVRGPGSALYGTGAVFAVVNLVTKAGKQIDGVRVSSSAGSFGRRGVSVVAGGSHGRLDVMVSGLWDASDGQRLVFPELSAAGPNFGVADGQDWDERGGFLGTIRLGEFSLQGRVSARSYGTPNPLASRGGEFDLVNSSTELRFERDLSAGHSVMARTYLHWFRANGLIPLTSGFDVGVRTASSARGAEVAWRWDPASFSRLTLGAEYADHPVAENITRLPEWPQFLSKPNSVVSLYAQEQLTIGRRLSLIGGLRGDFYSNGTNPVAPRAAAIYQAGPATTFKLLYGEAIRIPSATEEASGDAFPSIPALEPERIRTLEAVWDQRLTPWLQGSLSAFTYGGDNLIDQYRPDTLLPPYYANVTRVNTKGGELTLRTAWPDGLTGYASVELAHSQDEATEQRLSNAPLHMFKLGAGRPVFGVDIAAELRREAGRLNPRGSETDPFLLANLTFSRRSRLARGTPLGALGRRIDWMVQVRNVFDAAYVVPASLTYSQESFPQDGRSFWLRLGYRF